jgi:hypothetical protein
MKKSILLLFAFILFSGCLVSPRVTIKEVKSLGDEALIEVHSNKAVNAALQLVDEKGILLCNENVSLRQGNNSIKIKCSLLQPKVFVKVLVEDLTFSKEVKVQIDESNLNAMVLSLAEGTPEGELLEVYRRNLSKDDCTAELYVERMKKYIEKAKENAPYPYTSLDFDLNREQMNLLQEQIDKTKACDLRVEKEIFNKGNNVFTVNYSFVMEGNCSVSIFSPRTEKDAIIIQVDLKDNSTEVIKGKISSSQLEAVKIQFEAFDLLGGCMKAMVLGVNPFSNILYSSPSPAEREIVPRSQLNIEELMREKCFIASGSDLNLTDSNKVISICTLSPDSVDVSCVKSHISCKNKIAKIEIEKITEVNPPQ